MIAETDHTGDIFLVDQNAVAEFIRGLNNGGLFKSSPNYIFITAHKKWRLNVMVAKLVTAEFMEDFSKDLIFRPYSLFNITDNLSDMYYRSYIITHTYVIK